jgi:uracil phosphoribosyltransferase
MKTSETTPSAPLLFQRHHYGPRVFLLNDPFHQTILAQLCEPKMVQPRLNQGIRVLYEQLLTMAVNQELNHHQNERTTRMGDSHPDCPLRQTEVDPSQKAVVVDLARAGILPAQICYESLHWVLPAERIRQDHIFASRLTDESHMVVGTNISSHKIGGGIESSHVFFPDPMGATGSTIIAAIDFYKNHIQGCAKKYLALHLIVTPEYLKKVLNAHPDLVVFAFRLDRGLSTAKILQSELGQYWDEEKGLNKNDYIVPGAGGFGEIMNNSFV